MKTIKIAASLLGAATVLVMASCNSGKDYKDATVDSTQAVASADSAAKATADTSAVMQDSVKPSTSAYAGFAKPNPAKKHGKGKIILMSTVADQKRDAEYANMKIEMDAKGFYNRTEIRPSYPGGQDALAKFIQDNIEYPDAALNDGVEADVEVTFAVDENGKVYTPYVKGDKAGYGLDQAAINVVSKMPKWNPGQIKGKNVKSYYNLPISFRIN